MSARVEKLFLAAREQFDLDIQFEPEGARPAPDFTAPPYFQNLYREMETVKYAFPYMNVRLDYLGEPVLMPGVPKKIRFLLSNNSASISSDRVLVHLYAQDEVQVLPSKDAAVFLSMAHLGSGTKALDFEILVDSLTRPVYRFVAEFTFEENKKGMTHCVPFVLLNEGGEPVPTIWEKRGPYPIPNQPRV